MAIKQVLYLPNSDITLPQTDYFQCTHPVLFKNGFNPSKKTDKRQCYICKFCKKQFCIGEDHILDKYERAAHVLRANPSLSERKAAKKANVSRQLIRKIAAILKAYPER